MADSKGVEEKIWKHGQYAGTEGIDIDQKSINAVLWSESVHAEYISSAYHHIYKRQQDHINGLSLCSYS